MNITDVEDKIIKRVRLSRQTGTTAEENKTSLREFTGQYEAAFLEDLKTLNCLLPHHTPHATEHIADIIALIEKLIARGIAYKAADGSVYFSIEKYRGCGCTYGQLLKLNFDPAEAGRAVHRVKSDEYAKESVADFALWKARVPEDGDVFWKSESLGEGRPGWHIECSAMSMKVLGESFDLHLGGEDLIFPHHEDEIAQSEGATGKPFVKHWLHGAHLLVEGKKMSKSLGNFFTLRDLLAKGFTGREIRYSLLTAHYRETFNFTLDGLQGARTALARIDECLGKLREAAGAPASGTARTNPQKTQQYAGSETGAPNDLVARFTAALDDDLNISAAWAAVFEWVRETNRRLAENSLGAADAAFALAAWEKVDSVLGIGTKSGADIPAEILALAEARTAAKKAKDFKRADAIRNDLKVKGWVIEDTAKGPKLKEI
jgi:cysteinyl-tRNA synthetase